MPTLADIRVEGISIGGIETCIELPGYKLAFDIGRCPRSAVARPTVLFTHAHMDHMGGVAWHAATRALMGMSPPTYVVPRENADAFRELFETWRKLDRSDLEYELVPMAPGDEWALSESLLVRPFRSRHRVTTQGYGLWRTRHKLRPEYVKLPGAEIQRLREVEGHEVTTGVETPEVAFTGDSLIEVAESEEAVRTARLLIMEVTFLDDRVSVEQCRSKGHIHLYEVADRAELFENEALLLTHFSARYTERDILEALDKHLPPELRARTTPLLTGHRKKSR